jgi:hypothetical protein
MTDMRDETLAVFKDRISQLQTEAGLALAHATAGDIDGVHGHLGEVHMQLSAVMHILWHYRTELTVKPQAPAK